MQARRERQYTTEDLAGHQWTFSETLVDVAPDDATLLLTNYRSETYQVIETSTRIWHDRDDEGPSAAGRDTSRENDSARKSPHIGCQRPPG